MTPAMIIGASSQEHEIGLGFARTIKAQWILDAHERPTLCGRPSE
jgi:hypothetical protein